MPLIRSISGLRGTVADSLTNEIIASYAKAFNSILPEGQIVLGRDGRQSGLGIERIVTESIKASGRNVLLIGIAATPTVQMLTMISKAAGGISITASHNPAEWNGLKFIKKDGTFLDELENRRLWDVVDSGKFRRSINDNGIIETLSYANERHIEYLFNIPLFKNTDIIERLRKRRYKVVVDAVNASGSYLIPQLCERLGCNVHRLNCNATGIFSHNPEPLKENLPEIRKRVKSAGADLGIAVDPDADRLVLFDENGDMIGEENTIVLSVESVLQNFELFDCYEKTVVVNHSTTMAVEDVASKYGAVVKRSPVGEVNVVKLMKMENAVIGGEGSGGVILPALHYGRDSLVGIALVLTLLSKNECKLSEYVSSLPKYVIEKTKIEFDGDLRGIVGKLKNIIPGEIIEEDGIKILMNDSWVQLRKSNTEPIIRIIAEAGNKQTARDLIRDALSIIF